MEFVLLRLFIALIAGMIAALIANAKGRSAFGWFFGGFFLNLIGIIIVAVLPNLKEQANYRLYRENEHRRLREQLRQEQIKSESYRQYSMNRLDTHDQALGINTRSPNLLNDAPPTELLEDSEGFTDENLFQTATDGALWYYELQGDTIGPLHEDDIRGLFKAGTLTPATLVWKEGFSQWQPASSTNLLSPMGEA